MNKLQMWSSSVQCCHHPLPLPTFSDNRTLVPGLPRHHGMPHLLLKHNAALFKFLPKVKAASASPSSPAEFPGLDQLQGSKPKERRRRIAGIDQDELQDPVTLADPDSCFCEFKGVHIHHKVCDAEPSAQYSSEHSHMKKKISFPIILLHGFGASVFSWNRVMKPLAQVTGSKVLAFDRPAFGLTSRVDPLDLSTFSEDERPPNPYSILFSILSTLYFMDSLAAEKAIVVGHSAGALVAVETYFKAPERVAAMILVAPAIVSPFMANNSVTDKPGGSNSQKEPELSESNNYLSPLIKLLSLLSNLTKYIKQAIIHILKGMGDMIDSLYKRAFSAFLRSAIGVTLVRMAIDKFGVAAVRNAWFDANQVTDHVLEGYTKPLRVKGWDRALVEYTIAMFSNSSSQSEPPLAKKLSQISCPVLIVTGDNDRLVPSWNSRRLSKAIPGSSFEIIKNCGHLPHEERVEEFVAMVDKFLQTAFGAAEQQHVRAAT